MGLRTLSRILLATDFGPVWEDAWADAATIARTFGSEVIVVHAVGPEAGTEAHDEAVAGARRAFSELSARARRDGVDVAADLVLRSGAPAAAIGDAARELHPDLIVAGAGPRGRLARLLGSTAERLMRTAAVPVWLARPGRPGREVGEVVAAVDCSEPAQEALATAAFLARTFVARLRLLTVVPIPASDRLDREALEAEEEHLARCCARVDLHGLDADTVVRFGDPLEEILRALSDMEPDLLIVGTAARTGLARLWHANTAEAVLRQVSCSVLTVRADAPAAAGG